MGEDFISPGRLVLFDVMVLCFDYSTRSVGNFFVSYLKKKKKKKCPMSSEEQ